MNIETAQAIQRSPNLLTQLQLGAVAISDTVKEGGSLAPLLSPTMTEEKLIKTAIEFLPQSEDKTTLVERGVNLALK